MERDENAINPRLLRMAELDLMRRLEKDLIKTTDFLRKQNRIVNEFIKTLLEIHIFKEFPKNRTIDDMLKLYERTIELEKEMRYGKEETKTPP